LTKEQVQVYYAGTTDETTSKDEKKEEEHDLCEMPSHPSEVKTESPLESDPSFPISMEEEHDSPMNETPTDDTPNETSTQEMADDENSVATPLSETPSSSIPAESQNLSDVLLAYRYIRPDVEFVRRAQKEVQEQQEGLRHRMPPNVFPDSLNGNMEKMIEQYKQISQMAGEKRDGVVQPIPIFVPVLVPVKEEEKKKEVKKDGFVLGS
jgi:hypothetical protein